jgi:hypothetical protein
MYVYAKKITIPLISTLLLCCHAPLFALSSVTVLLNSKFESHPLPYKMLTPFLLSVAEGKIKEIDPKKI